MSGGSFGSRNDMISSKFNAVAKNQIWAECVRRETKGLPPNEGTFSVNPNKLDYMPLKPTQLDPFALQRTLDSGSQAQMDPELSKKIEDSRKTPQEKSKWPMTASQRIGWLWQEGVKEHEADKKWSQSLVSCDETKYAKAYVMMSGKSPFAAN
jgi:hypothetical protein